MPADRPRQTRQRAIEQDAQPAPVIELPEPPEAGFPGYVAALAWVQAHLPHVGKGSTNPHFQSRYADLADVAQAILPLTGRAGLAFSTWPTFDEDGRYVLVGELEHVSGEKRGGSWLLPTANPQAIGSSMTYGRRYMLSALTGVAPDDDDGQAAARYVPSAPRRAVEAEQRRDQQDRAAEQPQQGPDVDGFVAAVQQAVEADSLAALENLRDSAARRFRLEKTTEVADPATGETIGALELLRRAAAAVRANTTTSTTAPARVERVRVTAPAAEQERILSQWETPPATDAGSTTTEAGQ